MINIRKINILSYFLIKLVYRLDKYIFKTSKLKTYISNFFSGGFIILINRNSFKEFSLDFHIK